MSCPHGNRSTETCLHCLRGARDAAMRELAAYARRCGELEAQLCRRLVERPDREALLLVLRELRSARLKHPHFAVNVEEALAVLGAEYGEVAAAVLHNDVQGEHGVIREAAQVAAVAIRIIEMNLPAMEG